LTIYAVLNQKGGVGKSATAANLGAGLALAGRRVLTVDLDPGAGLTQSLLGPRAQGAGAYELLTSRLEASAVIIDRVIAAPKKGGSLAVIPAALNLAAAEVELADDPGRERILARILAEVKGFDTVLIDCGPSLSLLSVMALTAAAGVLVPVLAEFLAVAALARLQDTIDRVRVKLNPGLEIFGILATRFDARRLLNVQALEDLRKHFGGKVFKTVIRENIAVAEASGFGQTIFEYRPGSHGAEDYTTLTREFLRREKHGE